MQAPLTPHTQALAIEAGRSHDDDMMGGGSGHEGSGETHLAFYEITIASADQPKLLSRLSEALVSSLLVTCQQ